MFPLPRIPLAAALALAAAALPCIPVGAETPETLTRLASGAWTAPLSWAPGDSGAAVDWQPGATAVIAEGLSVSVDAPVNAAGLSLEGIVQLSSHPLTVTGPPTGGGTFTMPNISATFGGSGLVFAPGAAVESRHTITLADTTNGKIVISALGEGTEVTFNGFWDGWGSNTRHDIRIGGGARFVFGPNARVNNQMRDLVRARAAFAIGDGHPDNILEFHEGFNADLGTAEEPKGGLSTLRVGSLTMITHATQNLPTIHKFKGDGSPTHHGLLIFDQDDDAHWIVRTQDQEYDGGIYWNRDWVLTTETNLTSIPVNAPGEDVGFGSFAQGTVLTKRGPGALRLDHAQGYAAATTLRVEEGEVAFLSNPYQTWASGRMAGAGNHLSLEIHGESAVAFLPHGGETFSVAGIDFKGPGFLRVGAGRIFAENGLDAEQSITIQLVLGEADIGGLKIDARPELPEGTAFVVEAGNGFGPGEYPIFPAETDFTLAPEHISMPDGYTASFAPDTGILTVSEQDALDYEAWRELWFEADEPGTSADNDYSGDGLPNILAFTFDYDPRDITALAAVPAAPRIEKRTEGRLFRFRADPARTGVTITAEGSANLAAWTPVETTAVPGGDEHERGIWLSDAAPLRFFRIKVAPSE
ncbi:MAG: hypothetical protein JJU00_16360 [Opitutales bacterium]|nr:hypothetical protein [Opitutales bacterium]